MDKVVAVGVIVIVILCVGLGVYFVVSQSSQSHQRVIKKFTIVDETKGVQLTPVCTDNPKSTYWLSLSPYDVEIDFRSGGNYKQSLWKWVYEKDTRFACKIWGPDETGSNYYVEFGRLTSHEIKILYDGKPITFDHITDWSSDTYDGYPKPFKVCLED